MSVTQDYKVVTLTLEETSAVAVGLTEQEWSTVQLADHFKGTDHGAHFSRDLSVIRSALAKVRA